VLFHDVLTPVGDLERYGLFSSVDSDPATISVMSFDPRNRPASLWAGAIESYIHAGGKIGVLVELGCESDFVARTEEFSELMHDIAGINFSNRRIFIGRGVWPFVY